MAKKKKEKEAGKNAARNVLKKQEKQIKLIVIFMVVLFLFIFIFYWITIEIRKFEYAGLEFEKGKTGRLVLYSTKIPLRNFFDDIVSYLPVYFREDPRKLDGIEINGKIQLYGKTALAAGQEIIKCEDSILAGTTLSIFLKSIGIDSFPATVNRTEALQLNRTYVDCGGMRDYSVIVFKEGNETKIEGKNDCYTLSFANCEIMNVTERFMIGVYAHARGIEI